MKVVAAFDSFKGSLSSVEAGKAAAAGVLHAKPDAEVIVRPMADGGEGTTEALVEGLGGTYAEVEVTGPLGAPVSARYGILQDQRTAVMEMAQAAGIVLVEKDALDPWRASTTGVGEMIRDAIGRGCRDFLIGIGGSATTEGGIGMLQALGYEFYDENGAALPPCFSSLGKLARIEDGRVLPGLAACRFQIACDVTSPLLHENGAVYIYGPQKGVKQNERAGMDAQMARYADVTAAFSGKDYRDFPGAGAAGGLGFAFLSYLPHVELKSGISMVMEAVSLEKELPDADVVITGEGRLDRQSAMGKVPVGVAKLAKRYGCRVLAFAGGVTDDAAVCNQEGIDAYFPIVRGVTTLEEAMNPKRAGKNMTLAVEQAFRLL